jgi:adenosine deaminase/adenosine deaminase CECR1
MYLAFLACENSDLLVGINLVGAENHPVTQSEKALHFKMISFFRNKFPSVSVGLHAGELTQANTEKFMFPHTISQSVRAGAKRIGHGVAIFWEWDEEDTLEIMREQGIPLELNFGSNEFILGLKPEEHPWRRYQKAGVPLVFGSDDLGILRSDRNQEVVRFFSQYNGNYSEFKEMALNGIRYSFLKNDEHKERLLTRLLEDFDTFEKTF